MTLLDEVKALYERVKDLTREARSEILEKVPEPLKEAYYAFRKDLYYSPENAGKSTEHLSPSGRYKLVVTSYSTGEKTWNYTEGKVYRQDSDTPIGSIRRNYSRFPYLFVEDHADGHDYLIGGEEYQGQTILQLTTGEKRNLLPEEAKQGHGFCWASYEYNTDTKILMVDGCHWACPYEYRFFDFADPMNGWPRLEYEGMGEDPDNWVDADDKKPTFEADGTIITYKTKYGSPDDEDDYSEEDDHGNKRPQRVVATRTWKRDGLKLVEVASWMSDDEKKYRADQEEASRRWEEWLDNFRKTDPLYLEARRLINEKPFDPKSYMSIGFTYEKWCPDFKGNERRVCHRLLQSKSPQVTVDLEWAHETGPVKLVIYKDGKHVEDKFFMEHSVASIQAAFAYARGLVEAS